jgi:hypothetical protein
MMFFGAHLAPSVERFKACFRKQDHSGRRKVFIAEAGMVPISLFLEHAGEEMRPEVKVSLDRSKPTTALKRAIQQFNEQFKVLHREDIERTETSRGPDQGFVHSIKEDVLEAGYTIDCERLQPEALFSIWKADLLREDAVQAAFTGSSASGAGSLQKAFEFMRGHYHHYHRANRIRDEKFLGFLDALAGRHDRVATFRGIGHLRYYERVEDPPRIVPYDEFPAYMDELFYRETAPERLSDHEMARLAKHFILYFISCREMKEIEELHALVERLPDDINELERFFLAVRRSHLMLAHMRTMVRLWEMEPSSGT